MQDESITLTSAMLHAGESRKGGFTRRQLEILHVEYPPPAGWLKARIGMKISAADYHHFLALSNANVNQSKLFG